MLEKRIDDLRADSNRCLTYLKEFFKGSGRGRQAHQRRPDGYAFEAHLSQRPCWDYNSCWDYN
jgi:hypothetical protein